MSSLAAPVLERRAALRPFAFLPPDHPLRPDVERLWTLAAANSALAALRSAPGGPELHRSVLRLDPDATRLKWLSVSVQRELSTGFAAVTLLYRARRGTLLSFAHTGDPLLPAVAEVADTVGEVLQYMPRQRLAFRVRREGGQPREIGKCMRPEDLEPSWQRLLAVWRGAAHASFAVAEPRRLDRERGVFHQGELPGRDLASRIGAASLQPLLRGAGRVHGELHRLRVTGVPGWRAYEQLEQACEHARLLAFLRPDAAPLAAATFDLLLSTAPSPALRSFCHGDVRCGHVLEHEGLWSVVDFDGCRVGDPCQDVARLLAFLKRDVPYLRDRVASPEGAEEELEAAAAAYVRGHAEAGGPDLEPARLTWFLLAHELHYLARMLKRDLYDSLAFARGAARLRRLQEELLERLGSRRRP